MLVLAYHRIGDGSRSVYDRGVFSATADAFQAQLRCLKANCDVIAAADFNTVLKKRKGRHVLITFDDGYRDNHDVAFPILKSEGVSALFFLATGFLDQRRLSWWDEIAWMVRRSLRRKLTPSPWLPEGLDFDGPEREAAIHLLLSVFKGLPGVKTADYLNYLAAATDSGRCPLDESTTTWLTWDLVRAMKRGGMSFGGHTVNHPVLSRLQPEYQHAEIDGCASRLQDELGEPMRWFSYPNGKRAGFNEASQACLKLRGVELAFSYYGGCRRLVLEPRIAPGTRSTCPAWPWIVMSRTMRSGPCSRCRGSSHDAPKLRPGGAAGGSSPRPCSGRCARPPGAIGCSPSPRNVPPLRISIVAMYRCAICCSPRGAGRGP